MKFFKILICIAIALEAVVACNQSQPPKKSTFDPMRFMDSLKEPMLAKIPDSMKKWLPVFDSVRKRDQRFRSIQDPSLLEKNKDAQLPLDIENQRFVDSFIIAYGYPNLKMIGIKGMMAINMVIQHAPLASQEKYFKFVCEAYEKGEVNGETLALLEDRINCRNRRKQYYGTQLIMYNNKQVPYPIVNVDSLYAYRKDKKIPWTMEYYLKSFKSDWDSVQYKKILPVLIKLCNVSDTPGIHYTK